MLSHAVIAARNVIGQDDCVRDLALERGCKAVLYDGQAGFELIGVHVAHPRCAKLLRRTLIVSQVFQLIAVR